MKEEKLIYIKSVNRYFKPGLLIPHIKLKTINQQ